MARRPLVVLSLLALLAPGFAAAAPEGTSRDERPSPLARGIPKERVPGRALLRLHAFSEEALRKAAHGDAGLSRQLREALADVERRTGYRVELVRAMSFGWGLFHVEQPGAAALDEEQTLAAVRALSVDKAVAGASENRWVRPLRTPNDPGLQYMWHFDHIQAESAWDTTTGLSTQRVGVIDTGTWRAHVDLSGKDLTGYDFVSYTEISNDGNGRDADYNDPGDGGDCGNGFSEPDSWHGSHVAGTILANANDGVGVPGLSWGAQLVTGRALGRCGGDNADILEALAWMAGYAIDGVPNVGANAAHVVNMSLGTDTPCSQAEQEYISTITSQTGTIIVAAAGNSGNNVNVGSPANCNGVIGVGAHASGGGRPLASYSNFGNGVGLDIIGPGGEIYDQQGNGGVLSLCGGQNDCWTVQQGTSMASPHVAGVVSLMLAANPTLTSAGVLQILQQTGESCSGCGGKLAVRADLAVQAAASAPGGNPNPNPDPDPTCGSECSELRYSACTCGSADPCGWAGDGTCDAACADVTQAPFDDSADCGGNNPNPNPNPNPNEPPENACNLLRGNWDCPNGRGCVDDGNGDDTGACQVGAEGSTGSGGLCEEDDDCASGLCDRGVCTVPCDEGGDCRDGYECDEDAIPGGLCRPESCADSQGGICDDDWYCTYSEAERYVCAVEGEPAFGSPLAKLCACAGVPEGAPFGALALLGLLALGRRRSKGRAA